MPFNQSLAIESIQCLAIDPIDADDPFELQCRFLVKTASLDVPRRHHEHRRIHHGEGARPLTATHSSEAKDAITMLFVTRPLKDVISLSHRLINAFSVVLSRSRGGPAPLTVKALGLQPNGLLGALPWAPGRMTSASGASLARQVIDALRRKPSSDMLAGSYTTSQTNGRDVLRVRTELAAREDKWDREEAQRQGLASVRRGIIDDFFRLALTVGGEGVASSRAMQDFFLSKHKDAYTERQEDRPPNFHREHVEGPPTLAPMAGTSSTGMMGNSSVSRPSNPPSRANSSNVNGRRSDDAQMAKIRQKTTTPISQLTHMPDWISPSTSSQGQIRPRPSLPLLHTGQGLASPKSVALSVRERQEAGEAHKQRQYSDMRERPSLPVTAPALPTRRASPQRVPPRRAATATDWRTFGAPEPSNALGWLSVDGSHEASIDSVPSMDDREGDLLAPTTVQVPANPRPSLQDSIVAQPPSQRSSASSRVASLPQDVHDMTTSLLHLTHQSQILSPNRMVEMDLNDLLPDVPPLLPSTQTAHSTGMSISAAHPSPHLLRRSSRPPSPELFAPPHPPRPSCNLWYSQDSCIDPMIHAQDHKGVS